MELIGESIYWDRVQNMGYGWGKPRNNEIPVSAFGPVRNVCNYTHCVQGCPVHIHIPPYVRFAECTSK